MEHVPEPTDALAAISRLSLAEVEQRLADLDAERAALSLLRRSLAARDRAKRRADRPATGRGGRDAR
jgi:hypothetical protein